MYVEYQVQTELLRLLPNYHPYQPKAIKIVKTKTHISIFSPNHLFVWKIFNIFA